MSLSLEVRSVRESGENLFHLVCAAEPELLESYHTPGQFLVITDEGGAEGFFAIANRPGQDGIELLIKNGGDLAAKLCAAQPGAQFSCGVAQGKGFPRPADAQTPLHLFAMGSGIAPLRALIQTHLDGDWSGSTVTLWQSSFRREGLPFAGEYPAWREDGVRIYECLDDAGDASTGNVVDQLAKHKPDLSRCTAYWIGSKPYGEAVKTAVLALGLQPGAYLSNY